MLEGLAETLMITEFAVGENLRKTISSINPIESLQGQLQRVARNVKRWRGREPLLRREATGIQLAELASEGSRVAEKCRRQSVRSMRRYIGR